MQKSPPPSSRPATVLSPHPWSLSPASRLRPDGRAGTASAPPSAPASQPQAAEASEETQQAAEAAPETPAEASEGAHVVTSPIVGTFYSAPAPDADPYVQPGDRVRKGQVLCIVEAMKLMNEIESDVDGVVVEVYPKNGQPVEFGEQLFAIRAA